jgi:hypothetical protein
MDTRKRGATTEMQVTSIRLEPELKERLRQMSGEQGYQTLIRDVLWQFVEQQPVLGEQQFSQVRLLSRSDIRATFEAIAQHEERCAITGQLIQPRQVMRLGLTLAGELVPLSSRLAI